MMPWLQGQRAPCPQCRLCDGNRAEEGWWRGWNWPCWLAGAFKHSAVLVWIQFCMQGRDPLLLFLLLLQLFLAGGPRDQLPALSDGKGASESPTCGCGYLGESSSFVLQEGGLESPSSLWAAASAPGIPCCFHRRENNTFDHPSREKTGKKERKTGPLTCKNTRQMGRVFSTHAL